MPGADLAFPALSQNRRSLHHVNADGVPMDVLAQDLRFTLRTLRRDLGFTATIVLTLALGIGVNTAVFGVVRSTLLKPLPYEDPDRLAMVWTTVLMILRQGWRWRCQVSR
jgi:hypothetical protein